MRSAKNIWSCEERSENCDYLNLGKMFVHRKDFMQPESLDQNCGSPTETMSQRSICTKLFKSLLSLVLIVFISSCRIEDPQAKVPVITNSNFAEPSEMKLKEIFRIDSSLVTHPVDIKFDSNDDIFVVQYDSEYINKFDRKGNFIGSLNFEKPVYFFTVLGDTALIRLSRDNSIKKADLSGKIISEYNLAQHIPVYLTPLSNDRFIGLFRKSLTDKSELFTEFSLKTVDAKLNEKKVISSIFDSYFSGNIDFEIPVFPFTVDSKSNTVYVGYSSDQVYKIYAFDPDMKLKFIIKNDLPPVRISEKEIAYRKETAKKFRLPPWFSVQYKTFIELMQTDNSGNLWVRRASNTDLYGLNSAIYDIFGSDGKYISTKKIGDTHRIGVEIIRDGMLYIIRPFGSSISAYEFVPEAENE